MMRKGCIWMMLVLILGAKLDAQQVPVYSQYMLNGFLLNPAIAGSEGYTAVNLTAREQWVGLRDGPGTYALSFQTRILKKSHISRSSSVRKRQRLNSRSGNVGLGGYIFNHRNGAVERIGIKGSYAYHIRFPQSQLSFGLSLFAYQYRLDDDKIILEIADDPFWLGTHKSVFIPDADAGVYFSSRQFWTGFSVDQMFESVLKFGDSGYDKFILERNYYLIGGYDYQFRHNLIISPSTHLKFSESMKFQADINARLYYDQSYWGGLTYRTGHSLVVMAGITVDRLIFGYAFDIGLNSIMRYSYGTHEFTFVAKIGDNTRRYRWMNRF